MRRFKVGDTVIVQTAAKGPVSGIITDLFRVPGEAFDRAYVQSRAFVLQLNVPLGINGLIKHAPRARRRLR